VPAARQARLQRRTVYLPALRAALDPGRSG
jgi:hypothetical protein